jgi:hypothetical protein
MVVSGLAAIAFTNLDDVSPWTEQEASWFHRRRCRRALARP